MGNSYCQFVTNLEPTNVHRLYHDTEYGFPLSDDNELFGRLILEMNQAGLSWTTILNKQANFRRAYDQFTISQIAAYTDNDRQRLLQDAGIIRNRLKIEATIHNAQVVMQLQKEFGSFKNWLNRYLSFTKAEWTKLFKKNFKFTGGEIVNEFFVSTGYLPGAHDTDCPIYSQILQANPPWLTQKI